MSYFNWNNWILQTEHHYYFLYICSPGTEIVWIAEMVHVTQAVELHSFTNKHIHTSSRKQKHILSSPHFLWIGCCTAVHSFLNFTGSATSPYNIFITLLSVQLTLAAQHRPGGLSFTPEDRLCFILTLLRHEDCVWAQGRVDRGVYFGSAPTQEDHILVSSKKNKKQITFLEEEEK